MSKRQIIMLLGLWTAVFLFLGFPAGWDKVFAVIAGTLTIGIAYRMGTSDANGAGDGTVKKDKAGHLPYVEYRPKVLPGNPPSVTTDLSGSNPGEGSVL